jgi:GT2 family glycosyltransferase
MKTSIVITYYYTGEESIDMTINCLDSLKYGMPDEVILVNDGSKADERLWGYPGIRYYQRPKNGGYSACVNTGLELSTGDIIVMSNNDIVFTPGWLPSIIKPLQSGYDISSIRTSDGDGWATEEKTTEGDKFGSLWAMKRRVYETIGGYDEALGKSTFEDTDYRRRAIEAGFKIAKNHAAVVEHLGRATMDKVYPNREDFEAGKANYLKKWGQVD